MVKYLITGASGSLGKTLVEKIYNKDDFFYLFYNKKKPNYVKKNKNIIFCKFDFKNTHKIKSFLSKKFRSKLTNIDVLINCAGSASPYKKLNTLDYDEISEIYKINLFTPLLMFNFFINKHKKNKNKNMKIVNISTTSKGSLNSSHYSHSKKSINFYCYKLAENFSIDGVLINTAIAQSLNPPKMATAMAYAVEAGREAFLAGRISPRKFAQSSSPIEGSEFLFKKEEK
jgi:short-subunit dehydrogenase